MYDKVKLTAWKHRCNGRSCIREECRATYAWKRIKEIADLAEQNKLDRFITLSLDREVFETAADAWKGISKVWLKFRHRLLRKYKGIKFVCVLEKHKKNDYPHIHGLVNRWIDEAWMRKNWDECGGGRHVDIERVTGDITGYLTKQLNIAKYFGKDNLDVANWVAPRQRVIWKSRGLKRSAVLVKKDIGFLRGYHPFNGEGKLRWTQGELDFVLSYHLGKEDFNFMENSYESEERPIWSYVERSRGKVPEGSLASSGEKLASDRGGQGGTEASEGFERSKEEDQRTDQEAGSIAFKSSVQLLCTLFEGSVKEVRRIR